jgi:hypothetical protein
VVKGEIYMLPEIDEWIPETTWHLTELVEYDLLHCGEEYIQV